MARRVDWPTPGTLLALAVLVAAVAGALYIVIPVLFASIGLVVKVSTTGLATAGAVGTWVAPVASVSVAVVGVTAAARVIKKVADSAMSKPYEWGLPLLGVFGGVSSTVARDTTLTTNASKWIFGALTALWIVVAGACYRRGSLGWRLIAVLFYLLPPVALIPHAGLVTGQATFWEALSSVSKYTWLGVSMLAVAAGIVGLLAHLDPLRQTE